jgi:hypothetical protein
MSVYLLLHFRSYLLLPNLPKLLSTKQIDTIENVTVAPRGWGGPARGGDTRERTRQGGARHGQGILINERTNFKFSKTVTFDFPSPKHLVSLSKLKLWECFGGNIFNFALKQFCLRQLYKDASIQS